MKKVQDVVTEGKFAVVDGSISFRARGAATASAACPWPFVAVPAAGPSYGSMLIIKKKNPPLRTLQPAALARVRGGDGSLTSGGRTCSRGCPPNCPNHDIIVFDIVD